MTEALKCFTYLQENTPIWLSSLEDVRRKMEERQSEPSVIPNSVTQQKKQNTGSTESVRPRENDNDDQLGLATTEQAPSPLGTNSTPAAQTHAKLMKRKRKTASILSGQMSGVIKYRTRSMIVVYYDSEIQKSFENIVRNIGLGRNLLRKGKMAARMEALSAMSNDDDEDSEDDEDEDGFSSPSAVLAKIGYRPRIGLSPLRNPRAKTGAPGQLVNPGSDEAFDNADEVLETAQSLCERAAHQFLRDGDCRIEVDAVKECFQKLMAISEREITSRKEQEEQMQNRSRITDKAGVTVDVQIEETGAEPPFAPIRLAAAG